MKKEDKKRYRVVFSYTEVGTMDIEATSEADAREKVDAILEYDGLDCEYDCKDRDYSAESADII